MEEGMAGRMRVRTFGFRLVGVAERTEAPIGMSRRKTVAISTCIQEVGRDE